MVPDPEKSEGGGGMNWLMYILLGGGMILLGLAVVFLLFAELVAKAKTQHRHISREAGPDAIRPFADGISNEEKAALKMPRKEDRPKRRRETEEPLRPEKQRPS
jgi:hypothetical protein